MIYYHNNKKMDVTLADTEEKRLMASEIYRHPAGTGLTPEETAMLEEAEEYPLEYDEDSPKLTPEQLGQFRPVHYATMEERSQRMKATV
jgi:hypothetical protein